MTSNTSILWGNPSTESHAPKHDSSTKEYQSSNEAVLPATPSKEDTTSNGYAQKRPSLANTRKRRSTLIWAGKTPEVRQRKLEDVISNSMADTWFSLHCGVIEGEGGEYHVFYPSILRHELEPVYVSEVVPEAMVRVV